MNTYHQMNRKAAAITLGDWIENWLYNFHGDTQMSRYSEDSIKEYRMLYERYFTEEIRNIPLYLLDESKALEIWNQISRKNRLPARSSAMHQVQSFLMVVLDASPQSKKYNRNAAKGIRMPERVIQPVAVLEEADIYYLLNLHGKWCTAISKMALVTGISLAEQIMLKQDDIDYHQRTIRVCKHISQRGTDRQGRWWREISLEGTLKDRTVYFGSLVEEILSEWLEQRAAYTECEKWRGSDFLFCQNTGEPIRINAFYKEYRKIQCHFSKPGITVRGICRTGMLISMRKSRASEMLMYAQYGTVPGMRVR